MANAPKTAKTAKAGTEVATTQRGGADVPAYLQNSTKGSRLQHLDMSDFVVPRIKLLQGLSEEVKNYEDAKAGEFWMTVADKPLGSSLDIIVCANTKRLLLLAPITDSRGVLARADDCKHWSPPEGEFQIKLKNVKQPVTWTLAPTVAESGLAEFGSSNPDDPDSPPAATLFYDYLVLLPEHPDLGPCIVSLARSAAKKAKDLNGKLELGGQPIQSMLVTMGVMDDKSDEGDFYNYTFRRSGWVTEEQFNAAVAVAERFQDKFRASDDEYSKSSTTSDGAKAADSKEF